MTLQWILGWWNLIYLVPFGLALTYLGVYTLSGWTFGDADVEADVDADADIDADADVDAHLDVDADADVDTDVDADVDADGDVDADADADTDADADQDADHDSDAEADSATSGSSHSLALGALAWLGLGKVPMSILLMVLAMTWGFIGFVANQAAREPMTRAMRSSDPAIVALVSIPLAGVGAMLVSSVLSRLAAKALPKTETYARRRHELLGSAGDAIYDIDARFGMASVRDDRGNLFQIACRSEHENDAIRKGSRVKLVGYNARDKLFYVVPLTNT